MSSAPSADLERFITAQDGVYASVLRELAEGDKVGHWMWFIFPQLRALGHSATAKFYGLADLSEASAYLAHPLLGPRLVECCTIMRGHTDIGAKAVLGSVDGMKWRSCLTLFTQIPHTPPLFAELIRLFYASQRDERTIALIG